MSDRAPYSRVYWSIIDDPKFITIYDDNHHFATWMRLLLIADQAYPASAHLPGRVRKVSLNALVDAKIIDLIPGGRYRVHGLDSERERRKALATRRDPDGDQTGPGRGPDGFGTQGLSKAEPSKAEQSKDEPISPRADDDDPAVAYWELTGRFPTEKTLGWLDDLSLKFGSPAVLRALANAYIADRSTQSLLGRTQDRLRAEARELDRQERADEQARLKEKRAKQPKVEPWLEEYRRSIEEKYGDAA